MNDPDFNRRLEHLAELMVAYEGLPVKSLQREALLRYPCPDEETRKVWMDWSTSFAAAELAWPTVYNYHEFPNCPKCGARALLPEVEEIPEEWVSICRSCDRVTTFSQETGDDGNEP